MSIVGTLDLNLAVLDATGANLAGNNYESGHYDSPRAGGTWDARALIPDGFTPKICDLTPQPSGSGPAVLYAPGDPVNHFCDDPQYQYSAGCSGQG